LTKFFQSIIFALTRFRKKATSKVFLQDIQFIAAMGPPGGSRQNITPRFLRHFNLIAINIFSDDSMVKIFQSLLQIYLRVRSLVVISFCSVHDPFAWNLNLVLELFFRIRALVRNIFRRWIQWSMVQWKFIKKPWSNYFPRQVSRVYRITADKANLNFVVQGCLIRNVIEFFIRRFSQVSLHVQSAGFLESGQRLLSRKQSLRRFQAYLCSSLDSRSLPRLLWWHPKLQNSNIWNENWY